MSCNAHPEPLPPGADVQGFTPDPNLSWVSVYAAACEDPECEENHRQLFIVPIIGWAQVNVPREDADFDEWRLRPSIMLSNGNVVDYLDLPDMYRFVAVLRANQDVPTIARDIYAHTFGDAEAEKITRVIDEAQLPN